MSKIHAIYENGVFRPIDPVDLPDQTEVEFDPQPVNGAPSSDTLEGVYEVLRKRYDTGVSDLAERHNEHQP